MKGAPQMRSALSVLVCVALKKKNRRGFGPAGSEKLLRSSAFNPSDKGNEIEQLCFGKSDSHCQQ